MKEGYNVICRHGKIRIEYFSRNGLQDWYLVLSIVFTCCSVQLTQECDVLYTVVCAVRASIAAACTSLLATRYSHPTMANNITRYTCYHYSLTPLHSTTTLLRFFTSYYSHFVGLDHMWPSPTHSYCI